MVVIYRQVPILGHTCVGAHMQDHIYPIYIFEENSQRYARLVFNFIVELKNKLDDSYAFISWRLDSTDTSRYIMYVLCTLRATLHRTGHAQIRKTEKTYTETEAQPK